MLSAISAHYTSPVTPYKISVHDRTIAKIAHAGCESTDGIVERREIGINMDKHIKVMGRSDIYISPQSHQSDRLKVPDMITQPLWVEAARMIMESTRYKSFDSFREHMVDSHSYNSSGMRKKYSRYITKWFS